MKFKKTGKDFSTREGAEEIEKTIQQFWADEGRQVLTEVVPTVARGGAHPTIWGVKTSNYWLGGYPHPPIKKNMRYHPRYH